ncbi:RNA polymerase sigma factor [Microbacterium sp.]|uniref:RNA polymerase sigma factor n=1 Tax=Microbacterium sp. TaxID=51671 RepID=UPI003C749187
MTRARDRALTAALTAASPDILAYLQRRVGLDDAPDLLGETMVVAWRRAGDLPDDPERARMWLFGIARYCPQPRSRAAAAVGAGRPHPRTGDGCRGHVARRRRRLRSA